MEKMAFLRAPDISISVVSHSQIGLVVELLRGLEEHCSDSQFELILTLNQEESLPFALNDYSYPVKLLRNTFPKGFGANQNQAFKHACGRYFCVINPDIQLGSNPFKALLACMDEAAVGVLAPLVMSENCDIEVTARRFPSPFKLLCKFFGVGWAQDYPVETELVYPDWVGGMFMLFPRRVFEQLGGFDERYFLYYEDVDICARLRLLGYEVIVCPQVKVTHHAQRHSHRDFRYLRWHLRSIVRFFLSSVYWRLQCRPKR